jgi:hypothetical protein
MVRGKIENAEPVWHSLRECYLYRIILVLIAISFCFASYVNLINYIAFDSAAYFYSGLLIAKGGYPYQAFVDNKFPGIYYLFALLASFSNWNYLPALLIFRFFDLAILVLMYQLIRTFVKDRNIVALGLLVFWITYTNTFMSTFETTYCEMPQVVCLLISILFILSKQKLFLAGFFVGLAILFRQSALIYGLMFLVPVLQETKFCFSKLFIYALRFFSGLLIPLLLVVALGYAQGWLIDFWQQTIIWPYKYFASDSYAQRLLLVILQLFQNSFLIYLGIGLLVFLLLSFKDVKKVNITNLKIIIFFLLLAWAETSLTPQLWRHQFIPFLPALTLSLVLGLELCKKYKPYIGIYMLIMFLAIYSAVNITQEVVSKVHYSQEREVSNYISNWLNQNTTPEEKIYIWGFAPQI